MATGFMTRAFGLARCRVGQSLDFKTKRYCLGYLMAGFCSVSAWGADVGLAGVFSGKALLTIDGGAPRVVPVGTKTGEGVSVIAVDGETATVEVDGKRRVLRVGQNVAVQRSESGPASVTLTADVRGHFFTTGNVNGFPVKFLVDTGASLISIGAGDARRMGIDPTKGKPGITDTANGQVRVWRVKLNTVRVGDVVLNNVDAAVHESDMNIALLGMSFLNRMEMQRNGDTMTLIKRY